jgi:hypothetical protein
LPKKNSHRGARRSPNPASKHAARNKPGAGNPETAAASPEGRWRQFSLAHAGHPALDDDAVYALPAGLIEVICRELPGVLTADDEGFERDLTVLAGEGFFLRRPFPRSSGIWADSDQETRGFDLLASRIEAASQEIKGMLVDELKQQGRSPAQIEQYFDTAKLLEQKLSQRQLGYTGWLVTCAEFRQDRDQFRRRWKRRIEALGRFPTFPRSILGERPPAVAPADRGFFSDYLQFYRRWGLHTMLTWELPDPMRPELTVPSLYHLSHVGEAGVLLFVPWYLLRDQDIALREVAEHRQTLSIPPQLEPWVDGVPKNWGHDRYRLMLKLYLIIELCLKRRYGDRLYRKSDRLDRALSRYFSARKGMRAPSDRMMETIRKVRFEMNRRLRVSR